MNGVKDLAHDTELDFLCEVMQKLHIPASLISGGASVGTSLLSHLIDTTGMSFDLNITVEKYFGKIEPQTKYVYTDRFGLCYQYFKLPGVNEKNIGEYMAAGAVGAGVGGQLVNKEWIANGEFDKITALAKKFVESVSGW